jgi:NAD(P)-dependent dehydrogenase (short-subunit alcohol dehydrogenase family)
MEISNKVALITGSSDRVGRIIALTLSAKGAKVAIHYYSNEDKALDTQREIERLGSKSMILCSDISQRKDWMDMVNKIKDRWGRIDILVNNAAIFYPTPFFEITDDQWDHFMDTNLRGTFYGCQIIGELMYRKKLGKIINIADVSAQNVWPGYIPYCISKAGVIALTKGLSKVLAPYVTVNAVSPGTVLLAENYIRDEEDYLISRTPLKRIGTPEDIANTIAFLIEGSDFITGEIINVDGGRSLT